MTLDQFRIMHSTLIEHYQFIELHLEGIYAKICGKDFMVGLEEVEKHNIGRLIKEIKMFEEQKHISVFSKLDYKKIESICGRRNFWCHSCYTDMVFDRKTCAPKKDEDIKMLRDDITKAEQLRDALFQKKLRLLQDGGFLR